MIDPKIERPTRKMLGHAIRGELQDLAALIHAEGDDIFRQALALCLQICAYITVDVCERWPTDPDLRAIARNADKAITNYDIGEPDIHAYLSRTVFGTESLDQVLGTEAAGIYPLLITANLLLVFTPEGKQWWEYLDQIWEATETAERTDKSVFPALMLRIHMERHTSAASE